MRLVAGFEAPDEGSIALAGRPVAGAGTWVPPERRGVGIVPQEGALFPHLTVHENVAFGLPRPQRRAGRSPVVADLLALVGLSGYERRRPHELSGGQQQRVALARCLATGPSVVLLDEPFAALDASLRVELREETRRILTEQGTTTLLVTHDQDEALSMADAVVLMRSGRVVQHGAPDELYAEPADAWVASFVGDANLLPARLAGPAAATADTPLGQLPLRGPVPTADGGNVVLLRPEDVELTPVGGERTVRRRSSVRRSTATSAGSPCASATGRSCSRACRATSPSPPARPSPSPPGPARSAATPRHRRPDMARYRPVIGTLVYVVDRARGTVLLVHRDAREDDEHLGKWNGLGGKLESHEDVVSSARREVREEAELELTSLVLRGTVNWPGFSADGTDWFGWIFLSEEWTGTAPASNAEGRLEWIPIGRLLDACSPDAERRRAAALPMWEGDAHFLPLVFDDDPRPFHGVMPYEQGRPVDWSYVRG